MSTGIKAEKGSTVIADGADVSGHDIAIDSSESFVSAKKANLKAREQEQAQPKWHTTWWGVTILGATAAIIGGLVLYFGFGVGA